MKTNSLLSFSFLIAMTQGAIAQTSGGPDAFGYTWKNNADAQGPAYNWIDIKATGTKITGFADDNQQGPFNINWDFHYYWADYNKVWIGSNGWLSFQNNTTLPAAPIPTIPLPALPNNYLAPMSCDLTFTKTNGSAVPGASAWYWTNNTDTLIVQYDSVPYWVQTLNGYAGRYTFQVILSGADSSMTYQYKITNEETPVYGMAKEGLTTGIENSTGQIGLQVLTNVFPTASTAVKFYFPNPVTYQVFDATPAWNQNIGNGGFFALMGNNLNLVTDIENAGNQPLSNISAAGELFDVSLNTVWTSNLSVSALAAGNDAMLVYPTPYNANTAGTYMFRSTTTVNGDMNTANDITDVEMVVVDTSQAIIPLAYTEATTSSAQSSWGGNGGQGIYIEPPFYPAIITSLDFFVTRSGPTGYHHVQIMDDDGIGNSPGTVLYLDSADASAATVDAYNNIPVTTPVVINSGGVYVAWLENGDTASAIGTDSSLPLSNRNYEIIGGGWSGYRNNSIDDIMIKVNISKFGNITISTTVDECPSNSTGSATVNVSGGASPFSYVWNNGQTAATATGLAAGTYSVAITNANGAAITQTVIVYNNITVSITATDVKCYGGSNGTAAATIGGTAPYTYLWSNGQTTQTITGLSAGVYSVTASNGDGCMNVASDTVATPAIIASTFSVTAASCVGNDGSATAIVTGGTGAYTYSWNPSGQTTATATGLASGSYISFDITDANGCTSSSITIITTSMPFNVNITSTPVSCINGSDGTATATAASGGTGPYTYLWNNGGQTTQTITGLAAGTYTVTTTDAKGCTNISTVTLTNPTQVNVTATSWATTCSSCNDGSASAAASGGTPGYYYFWSNGQTTTTIIGLSTGTYTVCVTDSKGCSACNTATVIDGAGITEIYSGASIVISPNPFTNSAHIKIDFVNPAHNELLFTVYDIYGREIQSINLSDMKGSAIDFTLNRGYHISNGLYFYKLSDSEGILSAGKLIVQ